MEQLKYIALLHELITLRVANAYSANLKFFKGKGFIKHKYVEKIKSDVDSLACNAKAV